MEKIININTQKDFEALSSKLWSIIKERNTKTDKPVDDIVVQFGDGIFYFNKEKFLDLSLIQDENLSIAFQGSDNTIITARSDNRNDFKTRMAFVTQEFNKPSAGFFKRLWYAITFRKIKKYSAPKCPSYWENKFYSADSLIEVIDEKNKVCAVPYKNIYKICNKNLVAQYVALNIVYINVIQQFKSNYYKVTKIEDGKIYFICTDLKKNEAKNTYSINADYTFGKQMPMFRLSNVGRDNTVQERENINQDISDRSVILPKQVKSAHPCPFTKFIKMDKSTLDSLNINNITFIGNAYNDKDANDSLIYINNSDIALNIDKCKFDNIYSDVIRFNNSSLIKIFNCKFTNCWRYGIYINESRNALVDSSIFANMGLENSNNSCIRCDAANYLISNNEFTNYGYNGIGVGTWWGTEDKVPCSGKVSHNTLKYNKNYKMELMDSGAIYLWTQNKRSVISDNVISNYSGRFYNRGIFCDDGAYGFTLHHNTISNIANSYCIDSRRVAPVETDPNTKLKSPANIQNIMTDNIVDGPIKFEGNKDYVNDDKYKCTIKLHESSNKYKNIINNVTILN